MFSWPDGSRLSGYVLVTLALATAHLAAHSTWALSRGMRGVLIAGFYVGLPLIWVGLEARSRWVDAFRSEVDDTEIVAGRVR